MRFRRYTVSWKCERCHTEVADESLFCAREDCNAIHLFIVRCECGQRARFRYSDHSSIIDGRDTNITRVAELPPEVH